MKTGAILQVRMSSRRFPGKVLYKVNGKPILQYLLERLKRCRCLDTIVVATSTDKTDLPIEEFCKGYGVTCYRGPLLNVAKRFREVLDRYKFDAFVRVNGDSPLLDYRLIDEAMLIFQRWAYDMVTNVFPRSFPKGQSVEVLNSETYMKYCPDFVGDDHEHVTRYFYRNSKQFSIYNISSDCDYSTISLVVDTPDDKQIFEKIVSNMKNHHVIYELSEIVKIYQKVVTKNMVS